MFRGLAVAALLAMGCTTSVIQAPVDGSQSSDMSIRIGADAGRDSGGGDLAMATSSADLAMIDAAPDLTVTESVDMVHLDDLASASPPDLAFYPGCARAGLPNGASCTSVSDCCHPYCNSASGQPPYTCCYPRGINCVSDVDCCSGSCTGLGKTCL